MTIRISGEPPPPGTYVNLHDGNGVVIGGGRVVYRGGSQLAFIPGVDAVLHVTQGASRLMAQSDSHDEDFYLVLDKH